MFPSIFAPQFPRDAVVVLFTGMAVTTDDVFAVVDEELQQEMAFEQSIVHSIADWMVEVG